MRKIVVLLLTLTIFLSGCSMSSSSDNDEYNTERTEIRGVWITCYELDFQNKIEQGFTESIKKMFKKISDYGFNAVFVHVRSHSDAYYKSDIFPWSAYISTAQGVDPGFDPLSIMVKIAHSYELAFHAWINPFRVSTSTDISLLSDDNPAKIYLSDDDNSNDTWAKITDSGIFYNPAVYEIQKLIISGVEEVVNNYDVDGIHFDDYFYPTTAESFDETEYNSYLKGTASPLSLADFRRANINILISGIYRCIKAINPNVEFGISPQANIEYNINSLYADVKKWISTSGYVDYIAPQIYFGFDYTGTTEDGQPLKFNECADCWSKLTGDDVKLYLGLGIYRSGSEVTFGNTISNEWIDNTDIIKRQVEYSRNLTNCNGIIAFSYSNMSSNSYQLSEIENLKNLFLHSD